MTERKKKNISGRPNSRVTKNPLTHFNMRDLSETVLTAAECLVVRRLKKKC